jgi:hypothetical protein
MFTKTTPSTVTPVAQKPSPTPTPAPQSSGTPTPEKFPYTKEQFVAAVKDGYKNWFGESPVPVTDYAEKVYDEEIKYPIYTKYPFLIPAIAFLETRGGRDLQPQNASASAHKRFNATSWAIHVKPEDWTPSSLDEVLNKTVSGIGARSPYYKGFRETGNLSDIGNIYAPPSDNGGPGGTGGETYAKNLSNVMDVFNTVATGSAAPKGETLL